MILFLFLKIIIGIIVEVLSLIPSLLLVQFFRRIRSRRQIISPLSSSSTYVRLRSVQNEIDSSFRKKELTFPCWCSFVAYGFCLIIVGVSIFFIIARGIEFGDLKSQQWLISILSGLFSSILLTQPIKVILSFDLFEQLF